MQKLKIYAFIFLLTLSLSAHSQTDKPIYTVKAKLLRSEPLPAHCGYVAWALAQKFEIIESNIPEISKGIILIIEPCPEFQGKNFFTQNTTYNIIIEKDNDAPFSYVVINNFEKNKIPTFWSRDIKKAE